MTTRIAMIVLIGGLLGGAWLFWTSSNDQTSARLAYEAAGPQLAVAALSPAAASGRIAFNEACASCHGRDAMGGPAGPPLIHKVYEPSHHSDDAFRLAVRNGVNQHHWNFGNMPAQQGVSPEKVEDIIVFVRETQRANGIE